MWNTIFDTYITYQIASWVHWNLLLGDVLATIAVGWGILLEHGPPETRKIADRLVFYGIVAETLCSLALFSFDEGISSAQQRISSAQQSKIIALETKLAARVLTEEQQNALVAI